MTQTASINNRKTDGRKKAMGQILRRKARTRAWSIATRMDRSCG